MISPTDQRSLFCTTAGGHQSRRGVLQGARRRGAVDFADRLLHRQALLRARPPPQHRHARRPHRPHPEDRRRRQDPGVEGLPRPDHAGLQTSGMRTGLSMKRLWSIMYGSN